MVQGMFAEGQAYVALSRARVMEGLQIMALAPQDVRGCVRVRPPDLRRTMLRRRDSPGSLHARCKIFVWLMAWLSWQLPRLLL